MSSKRWATKAKALAIAAGLAGCSVCLAEAHAHVQAHQLEPRASAQQQVPFLSASSGQGPSADSAEIGGGSSYGDAREGERHAHAQTTAGSSSSSSVLAKPLFGRFLHVTDMHPDSFYKYGAAVSSGCHSAKPKKGKKGGSGKRRAGFWGSGVSDCDSPPHLVSATLDWVAENWISSASSSSSSSSSASAAAAPSTGRGPLTSDAAGEEQDEQAAAQDGFDYIIWTGDSARHDIDSDHPRTREEIFNYNRWALAEMERRFPGVAIVPSIGNNDIFPHNIMFPGPNEVTNTFASIWSSHLPESEFHVFQQGGYFAKEVLPDRLAVLSLNTLYFYDSNKAVDGCKRYKKSTPQKDRDPGTLQLDWIEVQIAQFRARGMQVQLIGHVPPTPGNYFARCYERYTDIVLRYQDTLLGQHFGHMNVDAIFVQEGPGGMITDGFGAVDAEELRAEQAAEQRAEDDEEEEEEEGEDVIRIKAGEDIVDDIRDEFDTLPGRRRTNLDHYNFYYAAPSVVPTYWPSVRVWTYNTSVETAYAPRLLAEDVGEVRPGGLLDDDEDEEDEEAARMELVAHKRSRCAAADAAAFCTARNHRRPSPGKHRKGGKKHRKPVHSSPEAPTRSNRFLTPLGYSQWVLDIDAANEEYEQTHGGGGGGGKGKDGKHGKHGKKKSKHKKHGKHGKAAAAGSLLSSPVSDEDKDKDKAPPAPPPKLRFHLEYATYTAHTLWSGVVFREPHGQGQGQGQGEQDGAPQQRAGPIPVPRRLLQAELQRFGISVPGRNASGSASESEEERVAALLAELVSPQSREEEEEEAAEAHDEESLFSRISRLLKGDKKGKKPKHKLPKEVRRLTDWGLETMTIDQVMELARRLANDKKLWKRYVKRVFSSSPY